MGISSRDYYRDDDGPRGGRIEWLSDTPTIRWIIFVTVGVFFAQFLFTSQAAGPGGWPRLQTSFVEEWFAMDTSAVLNGQVWRLLTYAFLHDRSSLWHIAMNMLILWFFGRTLERMYGSRELLLFYLTAAIAAAVGFSLISLLVPTGGKMLGASGAVMGVMMLYGIHFPRQQVWVWFIPVEIRWLIAFYIAVDLFPLLQLLSGEPDYSGVAHAAHLSGLLFGWIYYRFQWRLETVADRLTGGLLFRWKRATRGRHLKVYAPRETEPIDLEAELDRILEKIHNQGSESLTDRERTILTKASENFKRRN